MALFHSERLLIITKTYPAPSRKYRETSCAAAINEQGKLRRLFPIPFRLLDGDLQFQRWEWISARIRRADNDKRPESYRIDVDSIKRLGKVGTSAAWAERYQWIEPHFQKSFKDLEIRRQSTGETLGFIRPKTFSLIIKQASNSEWTEEEKVKLIRDGLFDSPEVISRIPLKKVPFDFYYKYECSSDDVQQDTHKITDWEVGSLYWKCVNRYGAQWEKYFRQKLGDEFLTTKELLFMMGTMHRFPDQWLIVGLVYPPKVSARQISMMLPPDG